MELKSYQQLVIDDIERYLEQIQRSETIQDAYHDFWTDHPRTPLHPFPGEIIEPYKDNIKGVPHICIKVPTAGGKTFIACNAIKTVIDARPAHLSKTVVWLVPSITILEQTAKNLKDPDHPYRQKINTLFANRVEVFEKNALLQGSGFNLTTVREQLCILVFSFDSLRAKNKDERKVYQENSYLQTFKGMVDEDEEINLMKVIKALNPVVVVDESHNAESALSVDMLKELNPWFIMDLTATPRNNSNILSFVDALELKKENMVKLPVIVYNHEDKTSVIASALRMQRSLEEKALSEAKTGGRYIRPIVLFQAQPKTSDDNTTFVKLKETLVQLQIPEEQIKIKTAEINELKGVDLLSEKCPVRYIITVNALKEGWDCPFAYILASLADKSSSIDVQQILGRVLRQPYVKKHHSDMMNMSYVFTASAKFQETLSSIVEGLNQSGFSSQDYKVAEDLFAAKEPLAEREAAGEEGENVIDIRRIVEGDSAETAEIVRKVEAVAVEQSRQLEERITIMRNSGLPVLPSEIQSLVKTYKMKEVFAAAALSIQIPQFFLEKESGKIFSDRHVILSQLELLEDFKISMADANIEFGDVSGDMYKIDLDETNREHLPTVSKMQGDPRNEMMTYILDPARKESRIRNFTARLMHQLGNLTPITDFEIRSFLSKALSAFSDKDFMMLASYELIYAEKIKEKIWQLSEQQAEKRFKEWLDVEKIFTMPSYHLPPQIIPGSVWRKNIEKSLYEKEGQMNDLEESVIMEVASLPNVVFWTKNIERKPFSFKLNGFVTHYPDFIILTEKGKIILLETKGDDRDNSDTQAKIRLGKTWEEQADKKKFRYFMVFGNKVVNGAYVISEFIKVMKEL